MALEWSTLQKITTTSTIMIIKSSETTTMSTLNQTRKEKEWMKFGCIRDKSRTKADAGMRKGKSHKSYCLKFFSYKPTILPSSLAVVNGNEAKFSSPFFLFVVSSRPNSTLFGLPLFGLKIKRIFGTAPVRAQHYFRCVPLVATFLSSCRVHSWDKWDDTESTSKSFCQEFL